MHSKLLSKIHYGGLFIPAYKEHSINNQRVENQLKSIDYNFNYKIIQITGILTRRIKSLSNINNIYLPGDKLGFIVLGSRVDIIIPTNNISSILVKEGQHLHEMQELIKIK